MEESVKEYHAEADQYACDTEKKENLELLKLSNGLKRVAEKKQTELAAVLEKRKCLKKKKKRDLLDFIMMSRQSFLSLVTVCV